MDLDTKKPVFGVSDKQDQTSLLSYSDLLENWNFVCSQFKYDTFQKGINTGADQSVQNDAQAGLRLCG